MRKSKTLQNFDDSLWQIEMDASVMRGCLREHYSMVTEITERLRSFATKFIPSYERLLRENARLKNKPIRARDRLKCKGLDLRKQ